MKKILSTVLAIMILTSCFFTVSLAEDTLLISSNPQIEFNDVSRDSETGKAIYKLAEAGVLVGDGTGAFNPKNPISRAELSKIINMIFGYTEEAETGFVDVTKDDWFYSYVLVAKKAGYIVGYSDGRFGGRDYVTREQVCTILCTVAKLYDISLNYKINDKVSDWAMPYVQRVLANAQMKLEAGDTFRATEYMTREEFSVVFANFLIVEPKYVVELKNSKGVITEGVTIKISNSQVFITLPDSVVISSSSVITVTVKDESGALVKDVKVTVTDKNKTEISAETDANGTVKIKKESEGGGGGGGGGTDYSEINKEAVKKLKSVSSDISNNLSNFPNPYQRPFINEVKKGIDKIIKKASVAKITKSYIKSTCATEIANAKDYFDTILADDNEKQKLQTAITSLKVDTINWLIDYFDIDIDSYI